MSRFTRIAQVAVTAMFLAGCGAVAQPAGLGKLTRAANAIAAYGMQTTVTDNATIRAAVLAKLQAHVAARHPGAGLALSAQKGWMEFHAVQGNPNVFQFNVMTRITGASGLPSDQAEFYGKFDVSKKALVPQTLWIGAEAEATHDWLMANPAKKGLEVAL